MTCRLGRPGERQVMGAVGRKRRGNIFFEHFLGDDKIQYGDEHERLRKRLWFVGQGREVEWGKFKGKCFGV